MGGKDQNYLSRAGRVGWEPQRRGGEDDGSGVWPGPYQNGLYIMVHDIQEFRNIFGCLAKMLFYEKGIICYSELMVRSLEKWSCSLILKSAWFSLSTSLMASAGQLRSLLMPAKLFLWTPQSLPLRGPYFAFYSLLSRWGCLLLAGRKEVHVLCVSLMMWELADLDVLPVVFLYNHLFTTGFFSQTRKETLIIVGFKINIFRGFEETVIIGC